MKTQVTPSTVTKRKAKAPVVIENIAPFNHQFRNGRAYYAGTVQYRARHGFGGYNRERATILIDAYNKNDIRIVQQ